jgi:pyruvate dehydrogenase E2 component (dihydrolipoyllysine-residue acetyltransferase)
MATPVELPKSGNTVEECVITRWVKRKGDAVSAGDVIADVETDKASFEITSPVDGTILDTFFEEGALVPVFTTVCVVGRAGESVAEFRPPSAAATEANRIPNPESQIPNPESQIPISNAPPLYSPRARRFAAERGFQPAAVVGSGPGGRVLERDVRAAYEAAAKTSAVRPSSTRETIARRLRESLASTAQYTLHASADAGGLLALRARVKAAPGAADITINDLVTFCTIQALLDAPELNAELRDGSIVTHTDVHIGFACDTPRGLLVPVVRNAHTLRIDELARRMKALAAQAVDGTISPDSLTGATFTISNLGALGIESFTPVINAPQVAILGVCAIQLKPVRANGCVEFIDAIGLSLTCDHQVIDGAPGARFLRTLTDKIEHLEYDVIMRGS